MRFLRRIPFTLTTLAGLVIAALVTDTYVQYVQGISRHWLSGGVLFAMFVIAMLTPAAVGESAHIKFSADLAHMLAFPLGWFSAGVGRTGADTGRLWRSNHEQ